MTTVYSMLAESKQQGLSYVSKEEVRRTQRLEARIQRDTFGVHIFLEMAHLTLH
jgi:hypothetical protein